MGLCAVLPLLKHLRQFIQATMVKMEDLVLALPARNNQLSTGACLIAVGQNNGGEQTAFIAQDNEEGGTSHERDVESKLKRSVA